MKLYELIDNAKKLVTLKLDEMKEKGITTCFIA